jgi:hypothetical protein
LGFLSFFEFFQQEGLGKIRPVDTAPGIELAFEDHLQLRLRSILRVRFTQAATMRTPPNINTRSPTLNSPSRAWSARNSSRVFDVAARHIGLAGCSVEGIPTTGIVPALASITRVLSVSPQSISRTPARTQGDRITRTTNHRIAQDSHSQITGCCVHAN